MQLTELARAMCSCTLLIKLTALRAPKTWVWKVAGLLNTQECPVHLQRSNYEGNYFIPALLPVQDVHEAHAQGEALAAKSSLVPLVFLFSDECAPSGLFCAVVVKLLSSNWEVNAKAKAYSNAFTLQKCKPKLAITLIDSFKSFEVHCSKEDKQPEIKNKIQEVIKSVIHSRKYKCGLAFFCPCSKCEFATLEKSGDICCDCDSYPQEETQKERKWLQGVSLFFWGFFMC